MNEIWLEDLVALADCLNFSRAAERRHVTQPAFGRRIKALEDWCGQRLVDRSSHRLALTEAGEITLAAARDILRRSHMLRRELAEIGTTANALTFASTQALAFSYFPEWVRGLSGGVAEAPIQLMAENMRACEQIMEEGRAQFLLCHAHPLTGMMLPAAHYRAVTLALDRLVPVAAARDGALFSLDAIPAAGLPLLAFDGRSGLGRIMEAVLRDRLSRLPLRTVFTSHLAMALKSMALEGKGIAWVPLSLVRDALDAGTLARAGGADWEVEVEIVLVRGRARLSPLAERFWSAVLAGSQA